ncbi:MAG TPA: glycosyltransferase family 9 protein, partial [bacterium]|nr:glycosyltransferase family 9 protein [bacterium]
WEYPAGGGIAAHVRMAQQLRSERFDVAIDWFSSPATARLAWLTDAPLRIGYALRGRTWAYSCAVPTDRAPGYVLYSQADLLAPLGVALDSDALELHLTAHERAAAEATLAAAGLHTGERLLVIAPAAQSRDKMWPSRCYAAVADALVARTGMRILLVGSAEEAPALNAVRNCLRHQALPPLPTPTLRTVAALLERAGLVLAADTGLRHMAMALGVPTVGVFGRAFPESWTPPRKSHHVAVAHDPGCKSACWFPHCRHLACNRRISVATVLQACLRALAAAGVVPSGAPVPPGRIADAGD